MMTLITSASYAKRLSIALFVLLIAACSSDDSPQPEKFTVNFETNDGTAVPSQSIEKDKNATEPTNPMREGYSFKGWFTDRDFQNPFDFATPITANTDLYAKWEEVPEGSFLVRFVTGEGASNVEDATVKEGQKVGQPIAPTRDGYRFLRWFTDEALQNAFDFDTPITANVILYAKWEKIPSYEVTFKFNNGDADFTQTVEEGKTATKPTDPIRAGYTFAGWHSDVALQNAFVFTTEVNSEITLYAKWEERVEKFWIPDANFRNKLKNMMANAFDSKDSLLIKHPDVTGLDSLDVSSASIANLTGIGYFTALTKLYCNFNKLASLDMSQNTALTTLHCNVSGLSSLDVSNNAALQSLRCYGNNLNTLDVSQNIGLKELSCFNNKLTELNVSKNTALTELRCSINRLTSLNVSQNTALTTLDCSTNRLTTLDITGMRSASSLSIGVASSSFNVLRKLMVHENLQTHVEVKKAKTERTIFLTISTFSAAAGSTDYKEECKNYDPNEGDAGSCKDTP